MPKTAYIERAFGLAARKIIGKANDIIAEYQAQGFVLTLRQTFYQFVSRDLIPNTMKSYKRLGCIISNARLAGMIDWTAIEDRTRNVVSVSHWGSSAEIVDACADQFRMDKWAKQPCRPEVWIEKEALAGVIEGVCSELDIGFLSCRGYTSQSEMWSSAMRLKAMIEAGQTPIILHLGDHDPSGLDMSRDITDRLAMFMGGVKVIRLALNMDQIEQYSPPPNPAKVTDSRFASYQAEYGDDSWELDALEPSVLVELIRDAVLAVRDESLWAEAVQEEEDHRATLADVAGDLGKEDGDED